MKQKRKATKKLKGLEIFFFFKKPDKPLARLKKKERRLK